MKIYLAVLLMLPIISIAQINSPKSSSEHAIQSISENELQDLFRDNFFKNYFEFDLIQEAFDLEPASFITKENDISIKVYSEGSEAEFNPEIRDLEVVENTERIFIKWNTYNDVNAKEILIQRSRDGLLWKNLEEIRPKGDYDELVSYHFVDYNPIEGVSYYRLKMTDYRGNSVVSNTKGAKVDNKGYVRCFPNPSTGIVSFFINSIVETTGIMEVVNSQGLIVYRENISIPEGSIALKRDFQHLAKGMYIIKLNFNSGLSFTQQEVFQD